MAESRRPAVLLGGGLGSLSAARTLGRNGVQVHLLGDLEGDDQAAASRFVRTSLSARGRDDVASAWMPWLTAHQDGSVLLPCSDDGLEFLAAYGTCLVEAGFRPVEMEAAAVRMALDKAHTYRVAAAAGLRVPRTAAADSLHAVRAAASEFGYPCALKPRVAHHYRRQFAGKAVIVRSGEELERAYAQTCAAGVMTLVTEIVPGPDRFCSYYSYVDGAGEALAEFTKRKVRQWPVGFGMGCDHVSAHEPEAAALGSRFARASGLRGLVNVEFKRDERDGQLVVIECNARITAANELVRRAGVDLVRLAYARAADEAFDAGSSFRDGVHQWHPVADARAFTTYRRLGDLTAVEWARSVAHPRTYVPPFDAGDPGPAVRRVGALLANALAPARLRKAASAGTVPVSPWGDFHAAALGRTDLAGERVRGGRRSSWRTSALLAVARFAWARSTAPRLQLVQAVGLKTAWAHSRRGRAFPVAELDREVYRVIWEQAARAVGAQTEDLGGGLVEIRRGTARTVVSRQVVMLDDAVTTRMSLDKPLVQRMLHEAGVQVPVGVVVDRRHWRDAVSFVDRHGPCVVKPAVGTGGGQGVTGGICTPHDLARAVLVTAPFGDSFLVERQVLGDEYRLLLLDGELIDCLHRRPPAVVGDGRSTVSQLVHGENQRRAAARGRAGLWPIRMDLDVVLTLERQEMTPQSIPAPGRRFNVKSTANESGAWDCEPADPTADVRDAATAAVRVVGSRLASVEVIRSSRADDDGIGVIDVNCMPGLHYHYQAMRRSAPVDVAGLILGRLLGESLDERRSTA